MESEAIFDRIIAHLEMLDEERKLASQIGSEWTVACRLRLVSIWVEVFVMKSGLIPGRVRMASGMVDLAAGERLNV